MEKPRPAQVGDFLEPDEWKQLCQLLPSDGYRDSSFPGCQFRLPAENGTRLGYRLAINVKITGRKVYIHGPFSLHRVRVRVEFVGDGIPSSFCGGWLYYEEK